MRCFLINLLVLLAVLCFSASTHAQGSGPLLGVWKAGGPPASSGVPQFDPSKKDPLVDLSLGNQTASTNSVAATGYLTALSVNGATTSQKRYFEIVITAKVISMVVGIGNASTSFAVNPGETANSIGYYANTGTVRYNATTAASYAGLAAGDVVQVAVDTSTNTYWFGKNCTFNGNPSAGTGGLAGPSIGGGTLYGLGAVFFQGDTIAFNSSNTLACSIPSGFTALL